MHGLIDNDARADCCEREGGKNLELMSFHVHQEQVEVAQCRKIHDLQGGHARYDEFLDHLVRPRYRGQVLEEVLPVHRSQEAGIVRHLGGESFSDLVKDYLTLLRADSGIDEVKFSGGFQTRVVIVGAELCKDIRQGFDQATLPVARDDEFTDWITDQAVMSSNLQETDSIATSMKVLENLIDFVVRGGEAHDAFYPVKDLRVGPETGQE